MTHWLNLFPILLILAALLAMLVFDEWRRNIIALAALYLGIFILLVQVFPLTLSAVKLITGWMSALLLMLTLPKENDINVAPGLLSNRLFKAFSLFLIWVIAFLLARTISDSFQIMLEITFAAMAIFTGGLLQLGMKKHPLSIILGILTLLAGFELLYASVETSVLINGLLAAINLLIALVGSMLSESTAKGDQE
jgi:hypothetical protein